MKLSRKFTGVGLIIFSAILLFITCLSQWFGAGRYNSNPPQYWGEFDPALVKKTPDLNSLDQAAKERAAEVFKFIIPELFIWLGSALLSRPGRKNV